MRSRKIERTRIWTPHPSAFGCHLPPLGKASGKCEQRDGGSKPRPTNVTLYSVHTRDNIFSVNSPIHISVATYFPLTALSTHRWYSISRQHFYPPPICIPEATYLHSSAGEFVYHKNRRWRSSPTVFFIKICSFVIYAQHFIQRAVFAQAKTFQESFLPSFFSKKRQRILASPRIPSHPCGLRERLRR